MAKCAFSGKKIEQGTGTMFVKNDGTVLHFANRKCMQYYLKLRKDPKKTRWTDTYHKWKKAAQEKKEKGGKK